MVEHSQDSYQDILSAAQFNSVLDSSPQVCMSTDAYGDIKSAYEILCSVIPNRCTYETTQAVQAFMARTTKIMAYQKKMIRKRGH